jgi:hypothetical protein
MGLAVDEGRFIGSGKRQNWGALVVDGRKARIVLGAEVSALSHIGSSSRVSPGSLSGKGLAAKAATRGANCGVRRG